MASVGTRDEFKKETIRALQERAGNKCSAKGCERLTSGSNLRPDKASRIGVAAYITAAAPGGPRYDPSLSSEERSSIRNGIWISKISSDCCLDFWRFKGELVICSISRLWAAGAAHSVLSSFICF